MKSKLILLVVFTFCTAKSLMAANQTTTVAKVNSTVSVKRSVDYHITGATPFSDEGLVNIVNTERAVVILDQIKPSVAIADWLSHVQIDGEQAVNGTNCQVKLYNRGCIILPYGDATKPLTVFSGQRYSGESVNNFGLENSGGFMNTLSAAKLNNRIRSFKLKRGYMVTFSTLPKGRGYSRCFIAADADLNVATLPAVLDQKISSYRIFKWQDTGKPQLAAAGEDAAACAALHVTSTYTWWTANSMLPDVENVPHHIFENYPSPASLGACTSSPHMKTNNEPMNPEDDPKGQTEDVDAVLANWEDLMATGMRLCSPSSWDGSDYTNGTGYLKRFIDSIDARGWRCDIIDLHCYWPEGNFSTIRNWTSQTGRPVWVSEWLWGASWNNNGAFGGGITESQNASALSRICNTMNNNDCIERYYYWNFERDPSRLYKNESLTEAGEYYATIDGGLGYNGKYDFVPTTPPQHGPSRFSQKQLPSGKTRLSWYDANGEFNRLMEVQMKDASGLWVVLDTIQQKEAAANYIYNVSGDDESILYRLHLIDLNGKEYYTNDDIGLLDAFEIDEQTYYAGGNLLVNGEFDLGFTGWVNGIGEPLSQPQFQVVGEGGMGGGAYLQSHLNGSANSANAVKTVVDLVEGQPYVFRIATRNGGRYVKLSLSDDGKTMRKDAAKATDGSDWHTETFFFNSETYSKAILAFYSLAAKAQIDGVQLRRLFSDRKDAIADGAALEQLQNEALQELKREKLQARLPFIEATLEAVSRKPCPGYDAMLSLLSEINDTETIQDALEKFSSLQALMDENLAFTRARKQPRTPSFAGEKSGGWQVKAGTYKDGDQRATTKFGKTCWNAWWSTTNQNATLEICQTLTGLAEGYYQLSCLATTEHFCITDQHAYLRSGSEEALSPAMTRDYFDLPVENHWDTLTTTPIYVEPNGTLTLGFASSKQGATGWWHSFGNAAGATDNREGWWCATGFALAYHAIDDLTAIGEIEGSGLKHGSNDGIYMPDGRRISDGWPSVGSAPARGIYIRVKSGQSEKIAVK